MKKITKITIILSLFLMLIQVLPNNVEAKNKLSKKIKLNKSKLSLYVGDIYNLKLKNNKRKVSWSSSKNKIVTVSSKGEVIARKEGNCKVTAKVGKKKYVCKVTVKKRVYNDTNNNNNENGKGDNTESSSEENKKYSVEIIDILGASGSYDKVEFNVKNTGTTKIRVGDINYKNTLVIVRNALAGSILLQQSKTGYGVVSCEDINPGESCTFSFRFLHIAPNDMRYYTTFHLCAASNYSIMIYDYSSGETHEEICYVR